VETVDGQGRPVTMQFDKFGRPVGEGMAQWKAPVFQNLGDRTVALDPVSLTPRGSFTQGMTPGERASNNIAQQRLTLEQGNSVAEAGGPNQVALTRQFGKAPPNYRWRPDGVAEAIPGGPADPRTSPDSVKRVSEAKDVLGLLDEVDALLPQATGSYTGAGYDAVAAGLFGKSTKGAEATAQLKALQGALVAKMPKMSGPQSDKDVLLYREMAGQVGDPTIPVAQRQAASAIIRRLNEKYAGMPEGSSIRKKDGGQVRFLGFE
jgi:hypothetical protein